ncbi:MAG: hypothetical protein IJ139_05610 [Bacteroidaceae bacterium]|nr:hypothetical protein [Bacteroidaceae bacterium]MBQ9176328.1 hypothetical protein [Bacteroidaceae bacterium]
MASEEEIIYAMMNGINFSGKKKADPGADRVKTKARAKSYKTGAHGSGAAKHKAEIKQKVRARKSQKRK